MEVQNLVRVYGEEADRKRLPKKPLEQLSKVLESLGWLNESSFQLFGYVERSTLRTEKIEVDGIKRGDGIAISIISAEGLRFSGVVRSSKQTLATHAYQRFFTAVKELTEGSVRPPVVPRPAPPSTPKPKKEKPPEPKPKIEISADERVKQKAAQAEIKKKNLVIQKMHDRIVGGIECITYGQRMLKELRKEAEGAGIAIPEKLLKQMRAALSIEIK